MNLSSTWQSIRQQAASSEHSPKSDSPSTSGKGSKGSSSPNLPLLSKQQQQQNNNSQKQQGSSEPSLPSSSNGTQNAVLAHWKFSQCFGEKADIPPENQGKIYNFSVKCILNFSLFSGYHLGDGL